MVRHGSAGKRYVQFTFTWRSQKMTSSEHVRVAYVKVSALLLERESPVVVVTLGF